MKSITKFENEKVFNDLSNVQGGKRTPTTQAWDGGEDKVNLKKKRVTTNTGDGNIFNNDKVDFGD